MAKKKRKSDKTQESDELLGHDPFEDLDMEWMDQEEGELSMEVLGHDPFEDLDVEWMDQEVDERAPRLTQVKVESAPGDIATEPGLPAIEELAAEPVLEEGLATDWAAAAVELLVQPTLLEPLPRSHPVPTAPTVTSRPEATFHFPSDFRWGVATAAHQIEGNNIHNDWWAWEQGEGRIKQGHRSELACDWWQNAELDFDHAAAMGLNALRLSIEWSRVEPRPGVFDDSTLERYNQMLQGLRARGIEPMITLHHFTSPGWLAEQGGWENLETIPLFARFVRRVIEALGQHCDLWCTINEPNTYSFMGYLLGVFPPGQSDFKAAMRVMRHLLAGHAAAYREIHALQPQARVGLAHNMRVFDPANPRSWLDRRAAQTADKAFNQSPLTALTQGRWTRPLGFGLAWQLRRTLDWIGLNYYTRDLVAFDRARRQALFTHQFSATDAELLDSGHAEFYARGMFRCLRRLAHLGLPIYVTENGIPDDGDDQRPRYLLTHLHQMWHAIQLCYPVMGYYHWTLVDGFEWDQGWTRRFGLIAFDPDTQVRTPRRSADLYAEIAQANAIMPQMIDAYAPELRTELLPG
jgi:beta-glucosidase